MRPPRAAEEVDGDEGPLARWAPRVSRCCNLLVIAVCATGVLFYLDQSYFENLARCGCGWTSHPRDACTSAAASLHTMTFSSLCVLHFWDRFFVYRWRDSGDNYADYALASVAIVALALRLSVKQGSVDWLEYRHSDCFVASSRAPTPGPAPTSGGRECGTTIDPCG